MKPSPTTDVRSGYFTSPEAPGGGGRRGGKALEQPLHMEAFWSGEDTAALESPTALWLTSSGVRGTGPAKDFALFHGLFFR